MPESVRGARFLIVGPTFYEWDLGSYLQALLRSQYIECHTFAYLGFSTDAEANEKLRRTVRQYRPDYVLGLKLERVSAETLQYIRRRGVRVVLWYVDCFTPEVPRWLRPLLSEVDLFLTTARGMIPKYQALTLAPVHWIFEGVYLPAFPSGPSSVQSAYGSSVAFIGSIFQPPVRNLHLAQRRLGLLNHIGGRFSLCVWGPQARVPKSPSFRIIRWLTYHEQYVQVCATSPIVLGINTVNSVELYFSNRTFLTLASGGFHLTEYVPGLEQMFENERHLVWYRSEEQCLDLIRYYLKRPAARARIAQQGQEWTRRRYGMRRQLNKIRDLLETL